MISASGKAASPPTTASASHANAGAARLNARLSAYAIDSALLLAFVLVFLIVASLVLLLSSNKGRTDAPDSAYYAFIAVLFGGSVIGWSLFNVALMWWRGQTAGMYIVGIAFKRDVSPVIISRMLLNLGLDAALGIVPLLGDAVDIGFKANQKNVDLLSERPAGKASAKDWAFVVGAALLFAGVISLSVYAIVALMRAIF